MVKIDFMEDMVVGRMQDVQEYWVKFMNSLHQDFNRIIDIPQFDVPEEVKEKLSVKDQALIHWNRGQHSESSIISGKFFTV